MRSANFKELEALTPKFYSRHAEVVAKDLLGKFLVRSLGNDLLIGKIVETESYHGTRDPASRAYKGKKTKISRYMWNKPGTIFVYMVHNNWMLNLITGKEGQASAVLIRALEPIQGEDKMFELRTSSNQKIKNLKQLCSGPGKLTKAFGISESLQEKDATQQSEIYVADNNENVKITKAHRIGVSRDTKRRQRFYISENIFVSK
jgi:DNA-3-methyladenine glycosylase